MSEFEPDYMTKAYKYTFDAIEVYYKRREDALEDQAEHGGGDIEEIWIMT